MSEEDRMHSEGEPSAEEMHGWLKRETVDAAKAMELRIGEATAFVEAYARKEISADQLSERIYDYTWRWGEALPGVFRSEGMTDEQILARVNKTRVKQGHLEQAISKRDTGSSSISRR